MPGAIGMACLLQGGFEIVPEFILGEVFLEGVALRSDTILILGKLFALGLVSQHDADHQDLPRQLEGGFQRGVALPGILDHVQHEAQIDDVGRLPGTVGSKDRVPACRGYVHAFEHAQVVTAAAAVVEERVPAVEEAESQQVLHGRGEARSA